MTNEIKLKRIILDLEEFLEEIDKSVEGDKKLELLSEIKVKETIKLLKDCKFYIVKC